MAFLATTPANPMPRSALRLVSSLPEELQKLRRARDLLPAHPDARDSKPMRATGLPTLDQLLDGGLPSGCLIELTGRRSSGRFAAALAVLAATTAAGEPAALVDLGDSLEPRQAAAAGVDLERLLWLRPQRTKQALIGAEMLLGCGFPLIVFDLGLPPVRGGRGLEAGWLRLARAAQGRGSTLLVCSPYRVSGTAASAVIDARSGHGIWHKGAWHKGAGHKGTGHKESSLQNRGAHHRPYWAPSLLCGLGNSWQLAKHRGHRPGGEAALNLRLDDHLDLADWPKLDNRLHLEERHHLPAGANEIAAPLHPAPTPAPSRPGRRPVAPAAERSTTWTPARPQPPAPAWVAV